MMVLFQNLSKQVMSEVKILKALKHVSLLCVKDFLAFMLFSVNVSTKLLEYSF